MITARLVYKGDRHFLYFTIEIQDQTTPECIYLCTLQHSSH